MDKKKRNLSYKISFKDIQIMFKNIIIYLFYNLLLIKIYQQKVYLNIKEEIKMYDKIGYKNAFFLTKLMFFLYLLH